MTDIIKQVARVRDSAGFLGYEYLTWLFLLIDRGEQKTALLKCETGKSSAQTSTQLPEVELVLANKLVTCLFNHQEQKTSISSPLLEDSHEVFASLKNGHLIESLSLTLRFEQISVHTQINARDLSLSQTKIKSNYETDALDPSLSQDEDSLSPEDKIREEIFLRMSALEDLERVLDSLYAHFLRLRLSAETYQAELSRMREQITERLNSYLLSRPWQEAGELESRL